MSFWWPAVKQPLTRMSPFSSSEFGDVLLFVIVHVRSPLCRRPTLFRRVSPIALIEDNTRERGEAGFDERLAISLF